MRGRPTADFNIEADIYEGTLTIVVTANVEDDVAFDDDTDTDFTAHGTVALGNAVAELGKVATPKTNAERTREENIAILVASGLSKAAAEQAVALMK